MERYYKKMIRECKKAYQNLLKLGIDDAFFKSEIIFYQEQLKSLREFLDSSSAKKKS